MLLFKNKIMENTKVIKNIKLTNTQIFSGFFWRLAERCGSQGISFIVMLILARMLGPEEYGTVALVTVVINILQVFVDSGLGNALIQKKNADDIDFSTVFYFNCSVCLLIYVLLFFLAPFIAVFYHNDSLTNLIRVLSISVIISGVRNVQQAIIARGLLYQKFFLSTAWGTIISAIIGITMAYCDAGIWALVMQQLSNICVGTIVLWHIVPWRPHWVFSINRLRLLYTYAWKLLVSALLDTCCNNLQQLIVGKFYSPMDLAFFNQGKKFPEILVANIDTSINGVLLPVMSQEQDNKTRIKSMARRAIKVSSFLIWPLMVGTILVAEPLIRVLLTDKWVPMVPFLKIFCLYFALWPIHTVNLSSINAIGRSDIFLKLELVKKCVEFLILATTMYFEPLVIAYGILLAGVIGTFINAYPNKDFLAYSYNDQFRDIYPYVLVSISMGCCLYPVRWLGLGDVITITVDVLGGCIIYLALSKLFNLESYLYMEEIFLTRVKRHRF